MLNSRSRYWLVGGLMVGILFLLIPLQEGIHKGRPDIFDPNRKTKRVTAINIGPTPALIAALGGFRTVAADLLWLKADQTWEGGSWWAVVPILDTVTQLDPHFLLAWQTYGWHCAYNLHAESQTMIDKNFWLKRGLEILQKGVEVNPKSWEMYFELAWTYYDRAHEPYRAAEWFYRADQFPDAPSHITRLYYRSFEHIMDFKQLFPALRYAAKKHTDDPKHMLIVHRDLDWWTKQQNTPKEHRRQIVLENTARKRRFIPYYLFPNDPFWEVCPACGLPSPKGSKNCAICGQPLPARQPQEGKSSGVS